MFAEQTYDIDPRIKYLKGGPGERSGVVGFKIRSSNGTVISKQIHFEYPGRLEGAAIEQLTQMLRQFD